MIKVVTIFAFILIGRGAAGGGRVQPQYLASGGWFPNGQTGMWLALGFALFSFLGIELLSRKFGRSKRCRKPSSAGLTSRLVCWRSFT